MGIKRKDSGFLMEKRAFERLQANINVSFICSDSLYDGTVRNLSENGMFITTREMRFPSESQFEISFSMSEKKFHVSVKLVRLITSPDYQDGIAVEISNPPREYLELVSNLRIDS